MTPIRKDLLPGLFLVIAQDGTWLHFETPSRKGAFSLEVYAEHGNITGEAVAEWCAAYRKTLSPPEETAA